MTSFNAPLIFSKTTIFYHKQKRKREKERKKRKERGMIKLTIVDPEGGEASQRSQRLKDPQQKYISLRIEVDRTEDNKGMDLSWYAHFSKKQKDKKPKDKSGFNYFVETTIVHPTDSSKNITQSTLFYNIIYIKQSFSSILYFICSIHPHFSHPYFYTIINICFIIIVLL